jgi:hypothetical protein
MLAIEGYSPLEIGGGSVVKACAQVVPPPTLTGKIARVERESNNAVSEQLQRGCEVQSIWCRNILADHPLRA